MRDTRAWRLQVWVSFGLAAFLCATGLAYLPGEAIDRAFMVMGYVFCLSTVFVLSKAIRDNQAAETKDGSEDSPMWRFVTWGGFAVAMSLTAWGLLRMEINETYRAFMGVCWLYLVTTAFTLAKTLRDQHEADLAEARWQGARAARAGSSYQGADEQIVVRDDA
ncbi:YiaA/YiaB family inner membrane protein [Hydrogenophaga sp. 5NK40-0174]|uniref:YiaA/YiaB family inner membrane protein n=1 Tax=Hydrogenophaga sp. 5NK40-0174 TaxID=3127649 RepID=UPI003104B093